MAERNRYLQGKDSLEQLGRDAFARAILTGEDLLARTPDELRQLGLTGAAGRGPQSVHWIVRDSEAPQAELVKPVVRQGDKAKVAVEKLAATGHELTEPDLLARASPKAFPPATAMNPSVIPDTPTDPARFVTDSPRHDGIRDRDLDDGVCDRHQVQPGTGPDPLSNPTGHAQRSNRHQAVGSRRRADRRRQVRC
jgi:hypothetical protein